ncbi:VOC family protein [Tropicibacter naphthalenivorans]|uniref:Putative ring-cleaving dioxygenase MhqO n=1 Tax=Tropicibacter naphthalenivorans TaxID=441103 RepID=A0A0P1G0V1_9RHOB|nr:VOC family protein [Tropicibacter naphthalenivorans]CUH75122.1 Putative ring-cleaving dioxygenase MhqO [Tropicibacter naphthalenivorans]SMC46571.1 glyoxalase family protein [Tropicibacter naphthalenivorans]
MLNQINGLHHVTSLASGAQENNDFFTKVLGLRRVKKTVNFDAPDVYHLYYGDEQGTPGTVMTYFPFPNARRGRPGAGEVGTTAFSVPTGALPYWSERLARFGVQGLTPAERFGERRLEFKGPDGDGFALIESDDDRAPWVADAPAEVALRGFHSADMRLSPRGAASSAELLRFMGYEKDDSANGVTRFRVPGGNEAQVIDLTETSGPMADQGAGSVHHIAFSVDNREKQLEVRKALMDTGYQVTPVIDRDYFWAIYFRTPGGVLFEIATNEPGFDRDEDTAHLGEALKLPTQHEHLRSRLEERLAPITD